MIRACFVQRSAGLDVTRDGEVESVAPESQITEQDDPYAEKPMDRDVPEAGLIRR